MLGRVPQSLCRLMLILEYMLHNFYDPPPELQEQVSFKRDYSQSQSYAIHQTFFCRLSGSA
ncbi:hypothetical protein DPMN_146246 [Dreissena polymorpha]|uniref:E3 ubiquitin-protein ligase UBR4 N-terminal domain-containing protein n=1 Tax=Dreissena polymorpha TaxID=45954 RepID=A0A9D4F6N9_DREPO|nr:hypothetical protein DPMN_146246 [Dreissena polymorpha]